MSEQWNPVEKPWRVSRVFQSGASYHHGWKYQTPTAFATYAEAYEEFMKKQGRGFLSADITFAENAATWMKNGKWKMIQKRKNGQRPEMKVFA